MSVKVGLIGYGLAGRYFHGPLIRAAGMEVITVATSRKADVGSDFPQARIVRSPEEAIGAADTDLVVIATPNDVHAELAIAALGAGKHVVVDKPFTVTSGEADRVIAAAEKAGRKLSVYQNRRWDADFLTLKHLLAAGTLGEVHTFESRIDRYRPEVPERWRDQVGLGTGLLYDLGPHLIDQALQLFGQPDWVEAEVMRQRNGAVVDDAFHLRLGKGELRINLSASALVADGRLRYAVHGNRGSFVKNGLDVQEPQLRAGGMPGDPDFGIEPSVQWGLLTAQENGELRSRPIESRPGRYLSFYEIMRRAIEEDGPVPVDPRDARAGIALIEAAFRASEAGKRIPLGDLAGA